MILHLISLFFMILIAVSYKFDGIVPVLLRAAACGWMGYLTARAWQLQVTLDYFKSRMK